MERKEAIIYGFYDFATTPVAFAINSMYLPIFFIMLGGSFTLVGFLPLISCAIAAFWTPIVGSVIDKSETPALTWRLTVLFSVLIASISIIVMSVIADLFYLVVLFTVMSISIQTGWTAVNAYLAAEGEKSRLGILSGIGALMGYIGGAIGAGGAVLIERSLGMRSIFIWIGIMLLVFGMVPLVLTKRGNPMAKRTSYFESLKEGVSVIRRDRSITAYLIGAVLWGDAVATIMTFASLLAIDVFNIPIDSASLFLGSALPFAILGAAVHGKLGDNKGVVRAQGLNLLLWSIGILVIIVQGNNLPILLVAVVAGFALGGNITLSRALYAKIIPAGLEGRLFGLSAIFSFFGGTIGPLLTGYISDMPGMSLRLALVIPLIFFIASLPTLLFIKEDRNSAAFQESLRLSNE